MATVPYATEEDFGLYPTGVDTSGMPAGQLARALLGASEFIDTFAGYGPAGYAGGQTAVRTFDGNDKDSLFIPDAISISQVTIDGGLVDPSNWAGYPEEEYLPFNRLVLYVQTGTGITLGTSSPVFNKGRRNVAITGVWGFSLAVPESIKEACILEAADRVRGRAVRQMTGAAAGATATSDWSQGRSMHARALELIRQTMRVVPL